MPTARLARLQASAGVALALVAAGCGPVAAVPGEEADGRPVVLATFTVLADMAAMVGGDQVRVESLIDVGAEIHGYEPSPDDLRRATTADLLLVNGLGLEDWVQDLVAPLDLPTVVLTEDVDPLPVDLARPDGPVNPHAWMSPVVAGTYLAAVARALGDLDPAHASLYERRAATHTESLAALHEELVGRLGEVPQARRLLVTCEGAFGYLARDAGLAEAYLWPVNSERQGTPRQVAGVVLAVRERAVPTVFCESTVSPTAQRQVARETGARLGEVLYVDSLSGPDGPVPTYLDLLEHDVDAIVAGLAR